MKRKIFKKISVILILITFFLMLSRNMNYAIDSFMSLINRAKTIRSYNGNKKISDMDTVVFGHYPQKKTFQGDFENNLIEWIILEKDDDNRKMLLWSSKILDVMSYDDPKSSDGIFASWHETSWEESKIRNWLNNDFINIAFDDDNKQYILETDVINDDYVRYVGLDGNRTYSGTTDAGNDTKDYVFLLSFDEINNYFNVYNNDWIYDNKYVKDVSAIQTDYAKTKQKWSSMYWLRTPGDKKSRVLSVNQTHRNVDGMGDPFTSKYGIRPAIWMSYDAIGKKAMIRYDNKNEDNNVFINNNDNILNSDNYNDEYYNLNNEEFKSNELNVDNEKNSNKINNNTNDDKEEYEIDKTKKKKKPVGRKANGLAKIWNGSDQLSNDQKNIGWIYDGINWYYYDIEGVKQISKWIEYNDNWYYLDSSGKMLTNTITPDGKYVDPNGKLVINQVENNYNVNNVQNSVAQNNTNSNSTNSNYNDGNNKSNNITFANNIQIPDCVKSYVKEIYNSDAPGHMNDIPKIDSNGNLWIADLDNNDIYSIKIFDIKSLVEAEYGWWDVAEPRVTSSQYEFYMDDGQWYWDYNEVGEKKLINSEWIKIKDQFKSMQDHYNEFYGN